MIKFFKEWWYSKNWVLITIKLGKQNKCSKTLSTYSMYWCYYNEKLKLFRINVGCVIITGKCESYPSSDFYNKYIFYDDYEV